MKKITHIFSLLAFLLLLSSCSTPLERAAQAVEEGNYDQALIEYDAALSEELSPVDTYAALTGRAAVYEIQGENDQALSDLGRALSVTNEDGTPAGDLGPVFRSRVDILTKQNALEAAAAEIDKWLNIDSDNLDLFLEQGQLLTEAEAWAKVVKSMDGALSINPSNPNALTLRGTAHLRLMNYDRAIVDLKSSLDGEIAAAMSDIDRKSNLVEAYYELGQALYKLGESTDAIDNYSEALVYADLDEDKVQVLAERGFVYSEMGEIDKAMADFDAALEIDPSKAIIYSYRSYTHAEVGEYTAAIADADKAIELGDDLPNSTKSAVLHAKASALRNNGQFEEALVSATESIELEGADNAEAARTYNLRSQINRSLGNLEAAVSDADKAISLGAQDIAALPGFYRSRSRAQYELNNYAGALSDQLASLELGEGTAQEYEYLGDLYYFTDDFTNSVAAYETAISLDPANPWLPFYLGNIYEEYGQLDQAQGHYEQALALEPNEAEFVEAIADMNWANGNLEAAEAGYKQAIALNPADPWLYNYLGDIYYEQDQYDLAAAEYQNAINVDDSIALFAENLGLVYRLQDNFESAVEAYTMAIVLDPERLYSWFGRGYSYYFLNQDNLAISDLQKAKEFELEPDLADFIDELLSELGA